MPQPERGGRYTDRTKQFQIQIDEPALARNTLWPRIFKISLSGRQVDAKLAKFSQNWK
jgi:hypothetical protein